MTPVPPTVVRWLIRELPKFDVLPPAWRLRFEVSWLKPDTRVWIIDPSIGGAPGR